MLAENPPESSLSFLAAGLLGGVKKEGPTDHLGNSPTFTNPFAYRVVASTATSPRTQQMGRFIGVDKIRGGQLDPQSWNRYSYGRSNPMRIVDPTGLYDCTASSEECATFEAARQADLDSAHNSAATIKAASAYGNPGDKNGITVSFGDPGKDASGATYSAADASGPGNTGVLTASVVIAAGQNGSDLQATVGHEGQHLLDAQAFVATIGKNGQAFGDLSKNLFNPESERNAYRISNAIYASRGERRENFVCGSCTIGANVPLARVDQTITKILATPGYAKFANDHIIGDPFDKKQ